MRSLRFRKPPDLGAPGLSATPPARGLFVTATDTEVGKTVVASAIAATLAARGERVAVFKPAVTGLDEAGTPDHELLRASARSPQSADEISPYRFGPPLSPHLAARLAGVRIERERLLECAASAARGADTLIVEGVGGLAVPLDDAYLVSDFALDLRLPLVVVAHPGLGTINHTLLTVESARADGLDVLAVVFTRWPEEPSEMELSNRETVSALTGVDVVALGPIYTGPPINAVSDLPLDRWLPAGGRLEREPALAPI